MKLIDCNLQNKKKTNGSSTSLEKRKFNTQDDELDNSSKSSIKKSNKKNLSSSNKDDNFYSKSERKVNSRLKSQTQSYGDDNMDEDYESEESFNSSLFSEEESKIVENGSNMNEDKYDNQEDASFSEIIPDNENNSYTNNKKGNKNNDKKNSNKNKNSISQSGNENNGIIFI